MIHQMKLQTIPFEKIKAGSKTISLCSQPYESLDVARAGGARGT